jgi:plasmid replication initiation protein
VDIKLDIKPEDVEVAVKEAIIKSSIGQMIERKVREATQDYNLDRAVDNVLRSLAAEHARSLFLNDLEVAARIKQKLVERLDDKFLQALADRLARAIERDY